MKTGRVILVERGGDFGYPRPDFRRRRGRKILERLLLDGAVSGEGRLGSHNGTPQRVAPPAINRRVNVISGRIEWYAVFEFREDRRWYCIVFKECCD